MNEQRFIIVGEEYVGYTQGNAYIISNGEYKFSVWESKEDAQKVCNFMNEQQATIQQQERKIRKCEAEVGRQLKQIIELQDELNECRARPTLATDERGFVKVEYR